MVLAMNGEKKKPEKQWCGSVLAISAAPWGQSTEYMGPVYRAQQPEEVMNMSKIR